jgi:hypothetical protein
MISTEQQLNDMERFVLNDFPKMAIDAKWIQRDNESLIQGNNKYVIKLLPNGRLDYVYLHHSSGSKCRQDIKEKERCNKIMEENGLNVQWLRDVDDDYKKIKREFDLMQDDSVHFSIMKDLITYFMSKHTNRATIQFLYMDGGKTKLFKFADKSNESTMASGHLNLTPGSVIELSVNDKWNALYSKKYKIESAMPQLIQYIKKNTCNNSLLLSEPPFKKSKH